jgi:hypothetical protein
MESIDEVARTIDQGVVDDLCSQIIELHASRFAIGILSRWNLLFWITPQASICFNKEPHGIFDKPNCYHFGRHATVKASEETIKTFQNRDWEFVDSLRGIDMTQSVLNALVR